MNIDTPKKPLRVVADTNILISALGFGGKPRQILNLILEGQIKAVISPILLAELEDVIVKKFPKLESSLERVNKQIRKNFKVIKPKTSLRLVKDEPDNRVIEAAVEGDCDYIVTGDRELLELKRYKKTKVVTAQEFLSFTK